MSAKTKAGATDEDVVLVLGEAPGEDATPPQDAREVWEFVDQLVEEGHVPLEARMTEDRQGVAEVCHTSCGAALCRLEVHYVAPKKMRGASKRPHVVRFTAKLKMMQANVCSEMSTLMDRLATCECGRVPRLGSEQRELELRLRRVGDSNQTTTQDLSILREARAAKAQQRLEKTLSAIRDAFESAPAPREEVVLSRLGIGGAAQHSKDIELVCEQALTKKTRKLDLSRNDINDTLASKLVTLAQSSPNLCSILLSGNRRVSAEAKQELEGRLAVNALRAAAEDPDAMRSLNQRELGDIGACIVAQHLRLPHVKAPSSLYLLGLAKAGIGARGAEALADALASSSSYAKTIRIVELYSNEPGLHWATFCARLIRQNRLQSIDVGSNGLDDEGAMLIAEALLDVSEASHLAELHLDYNRITDQGLRVLTQAAERALALHTVWLHGNPIFTSFSENGLERLLRPRQQARLGIPSRGAMVQDLQARVEELLRPSRIFLRDLDQGSSQHPDSLADEVASICVEAYTTVCPGHAQTTLGRSVLAGIVQQRDSRLTLVSLGVGTRFVDARLVASDHFGDRVKDSHAEVLARRGFHKYLASHLALAVAQSRCSVKAEDKEGQDTEQERQQECILQNTEPRDCGGTQSECDFKLRPGIIFHLFTSMAPCGSASSLSLDPCTPSCKGGAGTACAVYREGERHSCTDKVQRWAAQGLQGKRLKKSIGKVPLGHVVIGQKWSERCSQVIPGARSCTQKSLSALQGTKTFQQRGDSDASFAWWHGLGAKRKAISFDGKTGLTIDAQAVALAPRCLALEHEAALHFTHSPTPTGSTKEQKI